MAGRGGGFGGELVAMADCYLYERFSAPLVCPIAIVKMSSLVGPIYKALCERIVHMKLLIIGKERGKRGNGK